MRTDWYRCDGVGNNTPRRPEDHEEDSEFGSQDSGSRRATSPVHPFILSRRQALLGVALAAVGWAARDRTALADAAFSPGRRATQGDALVVLFLRGGMDGLNAVPPHGEDAYHRLRPNIGLAAPNDRRAGAADRALDLDGFFGLHPALAPLMPFYREGRLAFIHACGSGDQTRSHFEAMAAMERGLESEATGTASGWIARHLAATQHGAGSPLRAVAFTSTMPDSLRGATDALALPSLADFRLLAPGTPDREEAMRDALADLYREGKDAVAQAGRETLDVLDALNRLDPARYCPANGAAYPAGDLGNGFRQVACLLRANVGLEVAFLDRGGWDTHVAQGRGGGWMPAQLDDVGRSLAAFAQDLGPEMYRVTVVAMTEFGRRIRENSGLGTDHGRGSVMLLMGGGTTGGKVYGTWPGMEEGQQEPPGDLRVTTDYRDVLAEVVAKRLGNPDVQAVFPGHAPRYPGILRVDS